MGFSTSGSAALLALGLFIAFGTFQTATTERLEHVTDAKHAAGEDRLERINTEINVTNASYDGTSTLTVEATNNGSTVLVLNNDTDVLVDNEYVTAGAVAAATVDGVDASQGGRTDLWRPGETYRIEITTTELDTIGSAPDRVKIVVGGGVSRTRAVTTN